MKKRVALEMLENINSKLTYENWKNAKDTVNLYITYLEIITDKKIKKMLKKYSKCYKEYGEESIKTKRIEKKIDKEINKIYIRNY